MKKRIIYAAIGVIIGISCQQPVSSQVPEAVKTNFQKKYPGESDPDWHKDKNGNFESNFKKDGIHYRADFSPNGDWIETESDVKKSDLPDAVQKTIKQELGDPKIVEIEKVSHHSKGLFYDVEIKVDGKKRDVEINSSGKIIN